VWFSVLCLVPVVWIGGVPDPESVDPLAAYDLDSVTSAVLAPACERHGAWTIKHSVTISDSATLANVVTGLRERKRWSELDRSTQSHWFTQRKLKLALQNSRGQKISLWVELQLGNETLARFDRLPDGPAYRLTSGPLADTASTQLGEIVLQVLAREKVRWVSADR
jgi:hypothetical protein